MIKSLFSFKSNFFQSNFPSGKLWLVAISFGLASCVASVRPYHGFTDQTSLESKDDYVIHESIGGKLDPAGMAKEDQRYTHDQIAYNRMEEGYYQWGAKMYQLGYRDLFYVRDLAPRAFRHDILDTYDEAIRAGFQEAEKNDPNRR